jgi:hypothetical protein
VTQAYNAGIELGVRAANATCALGRPLNIVICDDQGTANGSVACGEEAKSNHSLAIFGDVGVSDQGIQASGRPGIFLNGISQCELACPDAYSSANALMLAVASVSAAKALGKSSYLMVLPAIPAYQFASSQIQVVAKILGVKYSAIFYPADTTDFAPIAAEIQQRHPVAMGESPESIGPYMSALAADGITPKTVLMAFPSAILTPVVLKQNAALINGSVVVTQTIPPSVTSNRGIQQFRQDVKKYGKGSATFGFGEILQWSNVERLVAALKAGGASPKSITTSQQLVAAVVAHPVNRPESAPYNFAANQIPQLTGLKALRMFTRDVAILKVHGSGQFDQLSGFINPLSPPDLGH